MGQDTKIEWADDTVNPWHGCVKVSPACANCYAETFDKRTGGSNWGKDAPRRFRVAKALGELRKIAKRAEREGRVRRVFVASMADVFEGGRQDVAVARNDFLLAARAEVDIVRWTRLLLLTKRPEVMAAWAEEHGWCESWWAGTTVEDQKRADERIPHLLRVPAPVRFLSCEPLLGAVDLSEYLADETEDAEGDAWGMAPCHAEEDWQLRRGIQWVIAGGESGPKARPMHPAWARDLRDQAARAGVAFHFKQWGEWGPRKRNDGRPFSTLADHNRDRLVDLLTGSVHCTKEVAGVSAAPMSRFGKVAAGRLLDGRTWDEVPDVG